MVRLSRKALRFAEDAASHFIDAVPPRHERQAEWERWRESREAALQPVRRGAVEVPDAVAHVLMSAVAYRVEEMQHTFDENGEDPDLGNDLAFLENVLDVLRAELIEAPGNSL